MSMMSYEMGIFGMPNPDTEELGRIKLKDELSSKVDSLNKYVSKSTDKIFNPISHIAEKIITLYWNLQGGSVSQITENQITETRKELHKLNDQKIKTLMPILIESYLRNTGESNDSIQVVQHYKFNSEKLKYHHHNYEADLIKDISKRINDGILRVKNELTDVIEDIINIEVPRMK